MSTVACRTAGPGGGERRDLDPPLDEEEDLGRGIALVADVGARPEAPHAAGLGELAGILFRGPSQDRRGRHGGGETFWGDLGHRAEPTEVDAAAPLEVKDDEARA